MGLRDDYTDTMRRHLAGTVIDALFAAERSEISGEVLIETTTEAERWIAVAGAIAGLQTCILDIAQKFEEHGAKPHGATRV